MEGEDILFSMLIMIIGLVMNAYWLEWMVIVHTVLIKRTCWMSCDSCPYSTITFIQLKDVLRLRKHYQIGVGLDGTEWHGSAHYNMWLPQNSLNMPQNLKILMQIWKFWIVLTALLAPALAHMASLFLLLDEENRISNLSDFSHFDRVNEATFVESLDSNCP